MTCLFLTHCLLRASKLGLLMLVTSLIIAGCIPQPNLPSDKIEPTLVEITSVPDSPYMDATPSYTFNSTEVGTIIYGGSCSSSTTKAVKGNNTITLNSLSVGYYKDCTIRVKDAAGNKSSILAMNAFLVGKPNNDTGITECGDMAYSYTGYTGSDTHNNDVDCANGAAPSSTTAQEGFEIANGNDSIPAGQDAVYGRDANLLTNIHSDGHKGFSFTKLSAIDGSPLEIQNVNWDDAGNEAAGTQWGCVRDNVTGLVWEVKTNDGGLRDKDWEYTWYASNSSTNGGYAGTQDTGSGVGSDACYNNAHCDTEKYVDDVNSDSGLCGKTDWHLPEKQDLQSIILKDRVSPAVDSDIFPNTVNRAYWSATPHSNISMTAYAWYVSFIYGFDSVTSKSQNLPVRLVRGGN